MASMIEVLKQSLNVLNAIWNSRLPLHNVDDIKKAKASLRQAIAEWESQEPVAWVEHHKGGDNLNWEEVNHPYAKATPLYTHPPQRTWVDLTQQELDELDEQNPSLHDFVQNLMSKIKEKNT